MASDAGKAANDRCFEVSIILRIGRGGLQTRTCLSESKSGFATSASCDNGSDHLRPKPGALFDDLPLLIARGAVVDNPEPWQYCGGMRAWLMDSYKGVEELRLDEVPDPQPGPGQALLQMKFAALNPADAFLAQGMYPAKPPLPHILGRDGVGKVIAVGPGVENVKVGDTVGILCCDAGVQVWGTLAEKAVIPAPSLTAVPEAWSLEETAGAPLVFLTAWQALTQWSDPASPPREGSVVLVTGASGGVGVASVLLGKSMGLVVVALSRSAEKGAKLKQLGADFVLSPETANLRKAVSTAIAPKKIDLVVDSVAGPAFNDLIAMLGYGGRISVVGRSSGTVPEFNTATLFFRRNRIGGVAVADCTPDSAQAVWKEIVRRLDALGKRPVVDRILPFGEVKAAFARLAEGPMGKVLVGIPS
ncbi:MAG: zinc-binding alcohol dehydrogenase family protein [Verrucomicrobia bacterium]|nr:zinc-binding alcohol dehydrogenase family protein [Verrucomicrobiota bacterium]MBV8375783.1 zinc-binding alcohol dehydrogenase family protein [Verrucomicrobiota bacterium]